MIKIKSVKIKWIYDADPDVSWLDTTAEYHYGTDGFNWNHVPETDKAATIEKHGSLMAACEHYAKEDQERLRSFYNNEWYMQGCIAEATVIVQPDSKYSHGRLQGFTSGGLWGIESDMDNKYREEIEMGQLSELKKHLEQFGVDTSDFYEIYEEGQDG